MDANEDQALVIAEQCDGYVVLVMNRPDALNALSLELREELIAALLAADADESVGAIVISGNDKVFAAGADIKMMSEVDLVGALELGRKPNVFATIAGIRTPVIAAVSGYALGGGLELALACDMIVAAETAEFGFPETMIGIIPGGGGTQRLTRLAGKQRAMELILTGRRFSAQEANELGIVSSIAKKGEWRQQAEELAARIARQPAVAVRLAKQAVLAADEHSLSGGIDYERRLFELAMATEDRVEGMKAFLDKRRPEFKGR
jgi:enoyl-CoA hydratase/carnithine racemase